MKPIIHNADYLLDKNLLDFEVPVEIHATRFYKNQRPLSFYNYSEDYRIPFDEPKSYKVLLLSNEPHCSPNRESARDVIKFKHHYDLILATDPEILQQCENSILFPYGTTWLNRSLNSHPDSPGCYRPGLEDEFKHKSFKISFMSTNHSGMTGYDMRRVIWNNKNKISIPTVFWSSVRSLTTKNNFSNTLHDGIIPDGDKAHLFNSQFSIIVENCVQDNYFSEKLIDCLITKTIPIYFGCPNINKFFKSQGILSFNTFEEFLKITNNITKETYNNLLPYIQENFIIAQKFAQNLTTRVQQTISDKSEILLTIGILTINERESYLQRILHKLHTITPWYNTSNVEIIVNKDNKEKTVGLKRNEILQHARGKYICFIDDDDLVSDDYITSILPELKKDIDCIGFSGNYYVENRFVMKFNHANRNQNHFKFNNIQYRPINHLNPIKTEIARQIGFEEKNCYEDSSYTEKLLASKLIKTEIIIDKILYHYYFDPKITATQKG